MNLQLSLKREWFEMTDKGIKTEDYRELNEYWFKRLVKEQYTGVGNGITHNYKAFYQDITFKNFTQNTMTLGYPKKGDTERIKVYEHKGIEIRTGNPEWGAEAGKLYFVIKHGKEL